MGSVLLNYNGRVVRTGIMARGCIFNLPFKAIRQHSNKIIYLNNSNNNNI